LNLIAFTGETTVALATALRGRGISPASSKNDN